MSSTGIRPISAAVVGATVTCVLAACSGDGTDSTDDILDHLPADTSSAAVLDVDTMMEGLDLDTDGLGTFAEILSDTQGGGDQPDPRRLLTSELAAVVPPLSSPFASVHLDTIQVGEIDAVTYLPMGGLVVIDTGQPEDEFANAYAAAGFDETSDGRYVLGGEPAQDDGSGGFPVVSVADGQLVLARTGDAIDQLDAGNGVSDSLRALFDAAEGAWAVSAAAQPDQDPGSCGAGQALVRGDDGAELLVLGGGGDVAPDSLQFLSAELGAVEMDGDISRYAIETGSSNTVSILATAMETPRLAQC